MPRSLGLMPRLPPMAATRANWRIFIARAATIGTGSVPVATAWRRAVMALATFPAAAASATVKPVASNRPA